MKNTCGDLNNYLFEQLELVATAETDDELDKSVKRAKSVCEIASKITDNMALSIKALKLQNEYAIPKEDMPSGFIGVKE